MKYKVGDKVKIVSLQSVGRGDCKDVVGDVGIVVTVDSHPCTDLEYVVEIKGGGLAWWEESNLELIVNTKSNTSKVIETNKGETEMNETKVETTTPKFKKGDKVKVVGETRATGVNFEGIYTIKNPSDRTTDYRDGRKESYHVSLEEADGTPNEDCLELYIEPRNYRNMKPTDLIKVSIDGFEDEIPLGDLIHTQALIGNSTGCFGYKLYGLLKAIDEDGICRDAYPTIKVYDQQEELMKGFFVIEADKANLKELISNKQNELKELQDKLNQLEN